MIITPEEQKKYLRQQCAQYVLGTIHQIDAKIAELELAKEILATSFTNEYLAPAPGSVPQAEPPNTKSFLGLPVYVDNPQFTGYGMAAYDSGDRKRVIGVLLENGHTWEYDAATVREARHEELPKMPRFIRERFKPWAGAAQPGDAPQKEKP